MVSGEMEWQQQQQQQQQLQQQQKKKRWGSGSWMLERVCGTCMGGRMEDDGAVSACGGRGRMALCDGRVEAGLAAYVLVADDGRRRC